MSLTEAATAAPRTAGVCPQLAPVLDERRQGLDHLGGHAGDAAREAGGVQPVLRRPCPVPPDWKSVSENGRALASVPRQIVSQIASAPVGHQPVRQRRRERAEDHARQRSGRSRWRVRDRRRLDGSSGSMPGGAVTCTGRNEPSLCGTSGASAAFIAKQA